MTTFEKQLNEAAKSVRMSERERERVRDRLERYSDFVRITERETPAHTWSSFAAHVGALVHRRFAPATLVAGLLIMTSGVSLAAEQAVPGDTLYSIKVNLNEEIVGALSLSDASRLSWEVRRAERRLEEASTLASRGDLDEKRGAEVAERLERHVLSVTERADELSIEDGLSVAAASGQLENALDAHEAILITLSVEEELNASEAEELAGVLRKNAKELARVREAAEGAFTGALASSSAAAYAASSSAASTSPDVSATPVFTEDEQREFARAMRYRAEESLRVAENRVRRATYIDGDFDRVAIDERLGEIRELIEAGGFLYTDDRFHESYEAFKDANARADRLTKFIDARVFYQVDPLAIDLMERSSVESTEDEGLKPEGGTPTTSATYDEISTLLSDLTDELLMLDLAVRDDAERIRSAHKRAKALLVRGHIAEQNADQADATSFFEAARTIIEDTSSLLPASPEPDVVNEEERETANEEAPAEEARLDANADSPAVPTETREPLSLVSAYRAGVRTVSGTFPATSTCAFVDAALAETGSSLTLVLVSTNDPALPCVEGSDSKPFSASLSTGAHSEVATVTLDGSSIPFTFATPTPATTSTSSISTEYRKASRLLGDLLDSVLEGGQ